jgi:hypothetical protein
VDQDAEYHGGYRQALDAMLGHRVAPKNEDAVADRQGCEQENQHGRRHPVHERKRQIAVVRGVALVLVRNGQVFVRADAQPRVGLQAFPEIRPTPGQTPLEVRVVGTLDGREQRLDVGTLE